jgi:phenylacetate-CoA ligase
VRRRYKKSFDTKIKAENELKALQLKGLQWTVNHVYNGSKHYKKKFDEAKVKPGDIKTLTTSGDYLSHTSKDLQEGYPLPLQAYPSRR